MSGAEYTVSKQKSRPGVCSVPAQKSQNSKLSGQRS